MNFQVVLQLGTLFLILATGPLIIILLASRSGNI